MFATPLLIVSLVSRWRDIAGYGAPWIENGERRHDYDWALPKASSRQNWRYELNIPGFCRAADPMKGQRCATLLGSNGHFR
jgi:hypothetical protein